MSICLLSHGNQDYIQGIDGEGIHIQEIIRIFGSKACPAMNQKPKLFFTNACRGLNELRCVEVF